MNPKSNTAYTADTARLTSLFHTLDTHKDGYVTVEELEAYVKKKGLHYKHADIQALVNKGDTRQKDGVLDLQEFIEFMEKHESNLWKHFVKLDRDGSGQISFNELSYYIRANDLEIPEERIRELITRLDKDGNLQISWSEFREFNQFRLDYQITSKEYYGSSYADNIIAPPQKEKKKFGAAEKLICGGIAGVVSRTTTAPFDRLKVLLQVQGQQRVLGATKDLGMVEMFRAMHSQGVMSMWRGNGVSCIKIFPENALRFLLFELLCDSDALTLSKNYDIVNKLFSGAITGISIQSLMYPVELTKTRVMTSPSQQGIWGTVKEIAGERGGVAAFYKGITPALMGVIPFAALQLGLSKTGTELWRKWNEVGNPGFWPLFTISSSATFVAMGCTYPLRLMTCQMQAYRGPTQDKPTLGYLFGKIMKSEGARGLYRGFTANAIKAVPASAIGWTVFQKTQKLYEKYDVDSWPGRAGAWVSKG